MFDKKGKGREGMENINSEELSTNLVAIHARKRLTRRSSHNQIYFTRNWQWRQSFLLGTQGIDGGGFLPSLQVCSMFEEDITILVVNCYIFVVSPNVWQSKYESRSQ